jgi:pyruvate/2-oxoglutarate dehydrogenase complex dihydrolipoamide dehydrogenase (E3) component
VALVERALLAAHAGETIAEPTFALMHGATVTVFSRTIHPYPTQTEALHMIGDGYR